MSRSSLITTDLAVATAGEVLHVFFQRETQILEARSPDGGQAWTTQDTVIAEDAAPAGSALCAYYVDKDGNFDNQPTIHLLYLNTSAHLCERVKRMKGDHPIWENGKVPDEVKNRPVEYSRICGGAYNSTRGWNPNGSQWAYFNNVEGSKQAITEIRRTPKDPWHTESILPENFGEALPGTSLACTIDEGQIQVFFQDHDLNIRLYENRNNSWHARGVYVDKKEVQPTTPLAATKTDDGKTHLFFAGVRGKVIHCIDGNKQDEVVNFYPGSKLGATAVKNELTLFYRSLNPVGEVSSQENQNGTWRQGSTVIPA